MFFKILLVVSLPSVCLSIPPTYPREKKSNQATYSQSFTREDVPLSYQYSAVHFYNPKHNEQSSEKPSESLSEPVLNPISYEGIQYAPLPIKYEERQHQNEAGLYTHASTQVIDPKNYDENAVPENSPSYTTKKPFLEPIVTSEYTLKQPSSYYVPGYNIHVYQPPTQNPEPNNYQAIDFGTMQEKQNVNQYFLLKKAIKETPFKSKIFEYYSVTEAPNPFLPNYNKNYQRFQPFQYTKPTQGPPALHAKGPQLQLNVKRGQKITYSKSSHIHNIPLHKKTIKPNDAPKNMNKLRPLPNHLHISMYSRTKAK